MAKKVRTQADRRQHATLIDNLGRKWQGVIEKDTMHPCSVLSPKGWRETQGCDVPDQYKTIPDLSDPFALVIDFATWIHDLEVAHADYEGRLQTTAAMMDPDNHGSLHYRTLRDGSIFRSPTLIRTVGQPPRPVELVRAMAQGNKWATGQINPHTGHPWPRPAWAEKFFPVAAVVADEFPDEEFPDMQGDGEFEHVSEYPDDEPITAPPMSGEAAVLTGGVFVSSQRAARVQMMDPGLSRPVLPPEPDALESEQSVVSKTLDFLDDETLTDPFASLLNDLPPAADPSPNAAPLPPKKPGR